MESKLQNIRKRLDDQWLSIKRISNGRVRLDLSKICENVEKAVISAEVEWVNCKLKPLPSQIYLTKLSKAETAMDELEQYLVLALLSQS